ncbi:MAG: NAD(P)-dependent oxidoreductase [Planctomycetota bacterium]|nr:MAG: NAD(P)-dependent oxidoreductase [Planctomycetota bacterium]
MKRVLVTGAAGLIGRHTIEPLRARGYEVHATVRPGGRRPPPGSDVTLHESDLLAPHAASRLFERLRPSHLLHLAWVTEHGAYWHSAENLRWCAASLELVRTFFERGGRRALIAGSCAEYDWAYAHRHDRVGPLRPATLYGACKRALHLALERWAPDLVWVRLFHLYGPGESPRRLFPQIATALLRGQRASCRAANLVRDLLHAADVGDAIAAVLDAGVRGALDLGTGRGVELGAFALAIARACGRPDLLDRETVACDPSRPRVLVADTRRLREQVGWRPRFDIESGVAHAVAALSRAAGERR